MTNGCIPTFIRGILMLTVSLSRYGHAVSNCVKQKNCDSPNESCKFDSFASAQKSTCETTCKDRALCQMYYFTGSFCSLYSCEECRFDDKSGLHLIYTCTTAPVVNCGDPPTPNHGTVTLTTAGVTTEGATAHQACYLGYDISGVANISCIASGSWSSPPITCSLIDCGSPTSPGNGTIELTEVGTTTYGAFATQTCNIGFDLTGVANITCGSDGLWDSSAVICTIKDCGFPDIPGNGSIILTNTATTYGASATQLCNTGYTLNGTENITCGADGNWSEPAITCTILDCNDPPAPSNGTVNLTIPGVTTYEATANLYCNKGYSRNGNATMACTSDGTWRQSAECIINDCKTPEQPANGVVELTVDLLTTYGANAIVTCNTGYELRGNGVLWCNANGVWSALPSCNIKAYIPAVAATSGAVGLGIASAVGYFLVRSLKPSNSVSALNSTDPRDKNIPNNVKSTDGITQDVEW